MFSKIVVLLCVGVLGYGAYRLGRAHRCRIREAYRAAVKAFNTTKEIESAIIVDTKLS